ncbi:hypothetical protein RsTz2092_09940 [Deferribacterales bacterium RsTz2092]
MSIKGVFRRFFIIPLIGLGLVLAAVPAYAIEAGANVGVYKPAGKLGGSDGFDLGDLDLGTGYGVHLDLPVIPLLLKFRLSADGFSADGKLKDPLGGPKLKTEVNGVGGSGMLLLAPALVPLNPYVGVGYGGHSVKVKIGGASETDFYHGVTYAAGVGVNFLVVCRLGLDATYFQNKHSGDKVEGYTVGLGLSVGL